MTTAVSPPKRNPNRNPYQPPYRVTAARVLRSEWHKLRSLRSSWTTLVSASALVLAVGLVMGATYTSGGGDSDVDTAVLVLYGSMLGTLCTVVLGILVTAGEYSTGLIRASLTAVPRRLPVLWAKAAVFTVTVFVVMFTTDLITFVAAQLLLHDTDQAASLGDPGMFRAIVGMSPGGGQGITGMRERASLYDGTLEAGPLLPAATATTSAACAAGWRVRLQLPLEDTPS
ncbi:hypothetical protein [Streptomyces sp. NBC_01618]|uniref:hypothetical protein n=1 Tax=Streptomyces sp. NBC_01618 TaxID=2975900 RepID=UPI003869F72D|nr:hypothetical protein OH735_19940 [Streptomyces sp. NBC_01618]